MAYYETKFRTIDGVELHARVYPAAQRGIGLVMCPGFNCVLTMLNLPECASAFQMMGITTLLYDPRSTGSSGGEPRNDIDPPQAVGDMSDALTHLISLPTVDPSQAGVFGISFGGTVALTAAAVDPRARLVVAVAPLAELDFESPEQRVRVLQKCAQDRASQVLGNPPFSVPMVNHRGENAVGFGHGIDRERYARLVREGREIAPGHVNCVTLMTDYKVAMWNPWPLWKLLGQSSSVLFVVPGKDNMSYPELQTKHFNELGGVGCKKKKIDVELAGHEDILGDNHRDVVVSGVTAFIKEVLNVTV